MAGQIGILLAGLSMGLLLAALVALLLYCRKLAARIGEQDAQQRQRIDQLVREINSYQQGTIRMGEELVTLRDQLKRVDERLQLIDQHDPHAMPYNQAARLVGLGASVEDLTQSCGLSKAEAELVARLHLARQSRG
jgi:hypothetical protein